MVRAESGLNSDHFSLLRTIYIVLKEVVLITRVVLISGVLVKVYCILE